jgi:undecaprenyl-diphosphatase
LTAGRLGRIATPLVLVDLVFVAALAAIVWHNTADATDSIDQTVARVLYARPGTLMHSLFNVLTFLGEPPLAWVAALLVGAWVLRKTRDRLLAVFCPAVVVMSGALEKALKSVVSRSRPSTALLAHESGHSFPSGHATAAAALAFSVALLLVARGVPRAKLWVVALLTYTTVIAVSRVCWECTSSPT